MLFHVLMPSIELSFLKSQASPTLWNSLALEGCRQTWMSNRKGQQKARDGLFTRKGFKNTHFISKLQTPAIHIIHPFQFFQVSWKIPSLTTFKKKVCKYHLDTVDSRSKAAWRSDLDQNWSFRRFELC